MIERALIEYLANAVWQLPVLAGGAWLLLRTSRSSPRTQHRVWLAVLGLAVLLPMRGIAINEAFTVRAQPAAVSPYASNTAIQNMPPKNIWREAASHDLKFSLPLRLSVAAAQSVLGLYLALIVFGFVRIACAWRAAQRLVNHSRETILSSRNRALLEDYGGRLQIKLPQLRESGGVSSPVMVGIMAPVLLLPEKFSEYTEDEVKAALCHELAHIQRRDYLVNLICQMAALPLAWHPAAYGVQQRIRRTREMACDAMAAQQMHSEIGYAKCLLALAQAMPGNCGMAGQTQALGLFSNNRLEERIMQLTEAKRMMSPKAKAARVVGGATVMAAAFVLTAAFHITPAMASSKAAASPETEQSTPVAPQAQPAAPASPQTTANGSKTHVMRGQGAYARHPKGADGRPLVILNRQSSEPDAEARRRVEKDIHQQMADAQRQAAAAMAKFNNPEFQQKMADMQRQVAAATAKLDSQAFKQQMADAQRQMAEATAKLDSQKFKQQMARAQLQAADSMAKFNSAKFKQQMADMQQQIQAATAKLNSPEFKQQMANAQRQVAEATAKLNSPEFKQKMADLQKQIRSQLDEANRMLKDQQFNYGKSQTK